MKCFVTGGTGFVGAHVVRKLVDRGDRVTCLVRASSNRALLDGLPVEIVIGNLRDEECTLAHLDNTDELYHVAADYRLWARDPREIFLNNVEGTRNVLSAALRAGVGRVIYTSTVGCLGLPKDGSPGTEETPVTRDDLVGHYKKSKYDAEQVALEFAAAGLDLVIVNPSTPVGPGDIKPTPTGKIVVDFLNGKMAAYVDTGLNLIAVEDVAEGHLLAAAKARAGQKYILGNRNLTLRQILQVLAEVTDSKAPKMQVPHWLAIGAAGVSTAIGGIRGVEPGIPLEGALMARKRMFFSPAKAISELGLPQSSVERALERAVRWFVEKGYTKAAVRL